MHVALCLDLAGFRLALSILGLMSSKRTESKEIDGSAIGVVVERLSTRLQIYEDTNLILDKDIKMKWQEVNDTFVGTFREELKDHQVYVNIHKSGLYQITYKYPMLPWADTIH